MPPLVPLAAKARIQSQFPKKLAILGSSGSIGQSTLRIVDKHPEKFSVFALTAHSRVEDLIRDIKTYKPRFVVVHTQEQIKKLQEIFPNPDFEIRTGQKGLSELARIPEVDVVIAGIVGMAALPSVIAALESGKTVALANKESVVAGGSLLREAISRGKGMLIPVDSEHSALFQCLQASSYEEVSRLVLTSSGGPFREKSRSELTSVTPEQAIKHPKWNMGAKISVDSATMMNKALEVIEAHWLFGIEESRIEVVVHPQHIIHSQVDFRDGSSLAQLSYPDMRIPIAYALSYPGPRLVGLVPTLDLTKISKLDFFALDPARFPAVQLARQVIVQGGAAGCVFNAANEEAVCAFLENRLSFLEIDQIVEQALEQLGDLQASNIEALFDCANQTRAWIKQKIGSK